jgi:ribonuclease P protein component
LISLRKAINTIFYVRHLSKKNKKTVAHTRFPQTNSNQNRAQSSSTKKGERAQAANRIDARVLSLRGSTEYARVIKQGRYTKTEFFAVRFITTGTPLLCMGVVVGKKFSPQAVRRNQAKRKVREFVRANKKKHTKGGDMLVFIQPAARVLKKKEFYQALKQTLEAAGIMQKI